MKALVIAAAAVRLQTVLELLTEVDVSELEVLESPVGDKVLDEFAPDLLVGVLSSRSDGWTAAGATGVDVARQPGLANGDVMLRVGRLLQRDRRALLIVPPPLPPPAPADYLVTAPCPVDDRESLRLHLWAYISGLPKQSGRRRPSTTGGSGVSTTAASGVAEIIRLSKALRRDSSGEHTHLTGFQIERLIVQLLQSAGADLAERPDSLRGDAEFDLAVLPSKNSKDVFLVDVAAGRLSRRRLNERALRLQQAVVARGCSLGLLVYQDENGRRFEADAARAVIVMAAEDLAERLQRQSLTDVAAYEVGAATRRI